MRTLITLALLLLSHICLAEQAKVAIIIDDIGYRKTDSHVLKLPGNLTLAILPHTPFGPSLAKKAYEQNKDVILHIPMESESDKLLGPGALISSMDEQAIRDSLQASFDEIPFAIGINNHMGSKLTQQYSPMAWTMRYLKDHQLLFVDSVTTQHSKARKIARHYGVPSLSRHLFLDNQLTQTYISGQFAQLVRQAKKYKRVVAIAHPHPETVTALSYLIPQLASHDIELVGISELLPPKINEQQLLHTD
ncbi:divergent polysaccharide deacetylase family protein [Thalassotalea sp. G2M2-11]|uniref:divergent polysaccharide deacetylase family protein n=1 Tax=Thalassotalea sp. G2M2-11 TaxID=2787627 RepID=UPI001F4991D9|nr:divergent polysaccharide deacetylase family protein [Thalassotalea sp. G2M2-11]